MNARRMRVECTRGVDFRLRGELEEEHCSARREEATGFRARENLTQNSGNEECTGKIHCRDDYHDVVVAAAAAAADFLSLCLGEKRALLTAP